jgi:hypothetical protein
MSYDTARAGALASLPDLGLDNLPAALVRAFTSYGAALALRSPDPPPAVQSVIDAVAAGAFDAAAAKGSDVITIDPRPIAAARAAETEHADRAAILAAIRDRAPRALCAIVDQHRPQIITAIQHRHAQIIGELVPAARRLPPGITDRQALDAGGHVREDFIATRDLAAQAEQLRALLTDVENVPLRGPVPASLEMALTYLRDPLIYDRPRDAYGQPGTPEFYRALARDADAGTFWLPTRAEQRARADELADERRLAGLASLPRGAAVW